MMSRLLLCVLFFPWLAYGDDDTLNQWRPLLECELTESQDHLMCAQGNEWQTVPMAAFWSTEWSWSPYTTEPQQPQPIENLTNDLDEMGFSVVFVAADEANHQARKVRFDKMEKTEGHGLFNVQWNLRIFGDATYVSHDGYWKLQDVNVQAEEKPPVFGEWKESGWPGAKNLKSHIEVKYSTVVSTLND